MWHWVRGAALVLTVVVLLGPASKREVTRRAVSPPAFVAVERGGMRYEFDALTGHARLRDPRDPDVDLLPERPEEMSNLRELIQAKVGISLEELRERHRESAEALRRLGYL